MNPKLILDGRQIKLTLERDRTARPGLVRVDWLRFTLPSDAVNRMDWGLPPDLSWADLMSTRDGQRGRDIVRQSRKAGMSEVPDKAVHVAVAGAQWLCRLCPSLSVGPADPRGQDFYTARCALQVEGEVVGYVMAGSTRFNQASTVHFNIWGSACLALQPGELERVADHLETYGGWITRVDLALDAFVGHDVTVTRDAYLAGEFDNRGKRPNQTEHGSWTSGHSRTFEVGSRNTGKLLRVYEKGDQLFGPEANDPWVRYEVEFRNNQRILEPEVLRHPEQFFAGAYSFAARILAQLVDEVEPVKLPTFNQLKDKTVDAAVTRVTRWLLASAAPAIVAAFDHGGDLLAHVIESQRHRIAGRLKGFKLPDVSAAFSKLADQVVPCPGESAFVGA